MKYDLPFSLRQRGRSLQVGLFVLLLSLMAAGCSSKGNVSGKVFYQGKPLPGGAVTFVSSSGKGAFTCRIQEDGSYRRENVPVGEVKIAIAPPKRAKVAAADAETRKMVQAVKSGQMTMTDEMRAKMPRKFKDALEQASAPEQSAPFPEHYSDAEKSGLDYTVTGGDQNHDIDLK